MASQNGLSNGVNGTTVHSEVEPVETLIEVKSIPNISIDSETVQDEVSQPAIVETVIQQDAVQAEIIQPDIQQEPVTPQAEEVPTVPLEVTANAAVIETPEKVDVPAAAEINVPAVTEISVPAKIEINVPAATEINGGSTVVGDVSPQPQVILETPAITREVEDVSTPVNGIEEPITKVAGYQPGTADFQVPQYSINALNRIAQDEGFTNYVINYDRGSNFGDGFVAEIVRAKIKGTQLVKGVQEESELVLVLKLPPENKTRREQMGMKVFEREVTVYNEILPMFQKFQLDKGLKRGQGFVSFPKCYYASFDEAKDESVIIMEDIRPKGFKMLNKYKTVDYPHATAVLETIAQFHGLSLAMKDQCPGLFEKFKGLKDSMGDGMITDMMKTITVTNCEKAIETLEPHEEHIKQKLRAFGENVIDTIKACTNGELSEPYTVINHGDCWINNIMFKYEVMSLRSLNKFPINKQKNSLSERIATSSLLIRLANHSICVTSSRYLLFPVPVHRFCITCSAF